MNFTRSAVTWLILSAALSACSDSDTVVALNVDTDNAEALRELTTLAVTFSQDGRSDFETELQPSMNKLEDGGLAFPSDYFSRITMPEGWSGLTEVTVEALAGSSLLIEGEAEVNVRENETTAAFVNLTFAEDMEPEPEPTDAGTDAAAPDAAPDSGDTPTLDAGDDAGDAQTPDLDGGLDAAPDATTDGAADSGPDAAPSSDAGDAGDASGDAGDASDPV